MLSSDRASGFIACSFGLDRVNLGDDLVADRTIAHGAQRVELPAQVVRDPDGIVVHLLDDAAELVDRVLHRADQLGCGERVDLRQQGLQGLRHLGRRAARGVLDGAGERGESRLDCRRQVLQAEGADLLPDLAEPAAQRLAQRGERHGRDRVTHLPDEGDHLGPGLADR